MIQEDYLVRQVNQFTKVLFKLFLNKEHQKHEESKEIINTEIQRITGLDLYTFLMVSPEHVIKQYDSGFLALEHVKYISDLLFYAKDIKGLNTLSIIRRLVTYYLFLDAHNLSCVKCLKECIEIATLSNISMNDWEEIIQFFIEHDDTVFAEKLIEESIVLKPNDDSIHNFAKNYFFSA